MKPSRVGDVDFVNKRLTFCTTPVRFSNANQLTNASKAAVSPGTPPLLRCVKAANNRRLPSWSGAIQ